MTYNIKILQGIANLTQNWKSRREDFYRFACANGDERWQRSDYVPRVHQDRHAGNDQAVQPRFAESEDPSSVHRRIPDRRHCLTCRGYLRRYSGTMF